MGVITTILLTVLTLAGAFVAGPKVLVVNSVPGCASVSEADRATVMASLNTPRVPESAAVTEAIVSRAARAATPDWHAYGKVSAPRQIMAKLAEGQDVEAINLYLQNARPWSEPGSTWMLHPRGDYDFTEVSLTAILYLFGDRPDRLYPETVRHILDVLLLEEGGVPTLKVPYTMGLIFDTENHVLMTESSRYLKNQWLRKHGNGRRKYDNAGTGLQRWMLEHLNDIRENGFHEFNSVPYQRYAMQALLNLEAFAEPPEVAAMARSILDDQMWRFAYAALPATPGGLDLRLNVPFRRQLRHALDTDLELHYLNEAVPQWAADRPDAIPGGDVVAAMLPYRPPQAAVAFARQKPGGYFVRIGHGELGSPEILSGGPGYVLSAGGVYRGAHKEVVPRATALLLEDGAQRIDQCFNIPGVDGFQDWNNTGVHRRFACGNAPVRTPEKYAPAAEDGGWRIFALPAPEPLFAAVYNGADFGLLALFTGTATPAGLLAGVMQANPDTARLRTAFQWPGGGALEYNVDAERGSWVITSVDGKPAERDYDRWPLLTVVSDEKGA